MSLLINSTTYANDSVGLYGSATQLTTLQTEFNASKGQLDSGGTSTATKTCNTGVTTSMFTETITATLLPSTWYEVSFPLSFSASVAGVYQIFAEWNTAPSFSSVALPFATTTNQSRCVFLIQTPPVPTPAVTFSILTQVAGNPTVTLAIASGRIGVKPW
jgi:hypothetical protein